MNIGSIGWRRAWNFPSMPDHPTRICVIEESNLTYPVKCTFFKDSLNLFFSDAQEGRENVRKYLAHHLSCIHALKSSDIIAP